MIPFIKNSRTCERMYKNRKQINGFLGPGVGVRDYKGVWGRPLFYLFSSTIAERNPSDHSESQWRKKTLQLVEDINSAGKTPNEEK